MWAWRCVMQLTISAVEVMSVERCYDLESLGMGLYSILHRGTCPNGTESRPSKSCVSVWKYIFLLVNTQPTRNWLTLLSSVPRLAKRIGLLITRQSIEPLRNVVKSLHLWHYKLTSGGLQRFSDILGTNIIMLVLTALESYSHVCAMNNMGTTSSSLQPGDRRLRWTSTDNGGRVICDSLMCENIIRAHRA